MDLATLLRHAPTTADTRLVRTSHDRVRRAVEHVSARVFARLERSRPWADALPAAEAERRGYLARCLAWLDAHLESAMVLGSLVYRVGAGPAGAKSMLLRLDDLASALLDSLEEIDPAWDEPTRDAWARLLGWATLCFHAGHEARLEGRVAAADVLHLSAGSGTRLRAGGGVRDHRLSVAAA